MDATLMQIINALGQQSAEIQRLLTERDAMRRRIEELEAAQSSPPRYRGD